MTDARWTRLKDLVATASARPPADRRAFLDAACPDDPELCAEAAALLAADADAVLAPFERLGGRMRALAADALEADALAADAPAADDARAPGDGAGAGTGIQIGPYRLVREIGRGGMGTVFEATRADGQYEQRVALKLIRAGAASAEAQRRFRAERQILARLEHPGIARLLDGGHTPPAPDAPDGLPYLVMERVEGLPLTAFADARHLGVEARLGLFVDVCEAVAYAHRHLVVHRDLKPANVFAADADTGAGRTVVKLLDFGIARLLSPPDGATGDGAPADDAPTETAARRLTPAYAAPEQLAGRPTTTATDVYALGVLLYELLVGHPPVRAGTAPGGAAHAAGRPSVAVDDPRQARRLRGDLDTVVMKALREEPERRYATAAELADDVRRYLAHEPVRARPDTPGYRARRFVRRHRTGVLAAVVVAGTVVASAVVAVGQARIARAEQARATATLAFFQSTLYTATPDGARPDGTLRAGLDSAAAHVDRDLAGQPVVAAAVHSTVGQSYFNLGAYDAAERHQRRALAHYARAGRPARLDLGVELHNLGVTLGAAGRPREALALFRRAVPIQRALGTPEQHASVLNATASALDDLGRRAEAELLYRDAIALWRRAGSDALPLALNNLAILYEGTRRTRAAVPLVEEAVAALQAQGPPAEPRLGPVLATLGALYDYTGRSADGAATLDSALAVLRRSVGPEHPLTIQSTASRALVDVRAGRPAAALAAGRAALGAALRTLPAGHPVTAHAQTVFADALCGADSARTGETVAREALAARRALYPPGHALIAVTESVLGACLAALGRPGEARPLLDRSVAALRRDRGDADARTADARARRARLGR